MTASDLFPAVPYRHTVRVCAAFISKVLFQLANIDSKQDFLDKGSKAMVSLIALKE